MSDLAWRYFRAGYYSYGENGRRGINYLFLSPPGEAKTSLIRLFARTVACRIETMEGSRKEPQDIAGLPFPAQDHRSFTFLPPAELRRLADAGDGVLFFDEYTQAPASVQKACLNLILDGATEGLTLPPGIARWAAANPAAMVGGTELDPANVSRMVLIEWPLMSAGAFRDHLVSSDSRSGEGHAPEWFSPQESAANLERKWDAAIGLARTYIGSFITRNPSCLREDAPSDMRPWANPRTWSMAARSLAAGDVHGEGWDFKIDLISGSVGRGNATTFVTWLRTMDLPDPVDLLEGKVTYDLASDTRADRIYTILDATISSIETEKARVEKEKKNDYARLRAWVSAWVGLLAVAVRRKDVRDIAAASVARAIKVPELMQDRAFIQEVIKVKDFCKVINAVEKAK